MATVVVKAVLDGCWCSGCRHSPRTGKPTPRRPHMGACAAAIIYEHPKPVPYEPTTSTGTAHFTFTFANGEVAQMPTLATPGASLTNAGMVYPAPKQTHYTNIPVLW